MTAGRALRDGVEAAVAQALEVLRSRPSALITDVDGTISPIVPRPEDAFVRDGTKASLRALAARLDLVAVISGRAEAVARAMVGCEELTYIGNYGLVEGAASPPAAAELVALRARVAARLAHLPCVTLEDKGTGFAMHYRGCEDGERVRDELLALVGADAAAAGGKLLEGKQVLEVVPRSLPGKDTSIAKLAADRRLSGIVYVGDDASDVVVFEELARRRAAGAPGLAVASIDAETPQRVRLAADVRLAGVGAVGAFLAALARSLAGSGARR